MTNTRKKAIPPYLQSSVSAQFLAKNPAYKDVFQKCVNCGKYSLKPVGLKQMKNPIVDARDANERRCALCNYVHVKNLVVSTIAASEAAPINVTESIDAIKKGRILQGE